MQDHLSKNNVLYIHQIHTLYIENQKGINSIHTENQKGVNSKDIVHPPPPPPPPRLSTM